MEDDGGIATTVVIKARSAYTWLDKLRFLKGLPPDDVSRTLSIHAWVGNTIDSFLWVWYSHCGIDIVVCWVWCVLVVVVVVVVEALGLLNGDCSGE